MGRCSCREISSGLYEVESSTRTVILDHNEITAILDYFREREWEAGIREAIDNHPENDLIENKEEFVKDCLDEIRSRYEIYGKFNGDYEDIVSYLI